MAGCTLPSTPSSCIHFLELIEELVISIRGPLHPDTALYKKPADADALVVACRFHHERHDLLSWNAVVHTELHNERNCRVTNRVQFPHGVLHGRLSR